MAIFALLWIKISTIPYAERKPASISEIVKRRNNRGANALRKVWEKWVDIELKFSLKLNSLSKPDWRKRIEKNAAKPILTSINADGDVEKNRSICSIVEYKPNIRA